MLSHFWQGGVQRVHLLDGTVGGALLLELFQRDGIGTMVARCIFSLVSSVFTHRNKHTNTHTHTYKKIYTYIYIDHMSKGVCVCVCSLCVHIYTD